MGRLDGLDSLISCKDEMYKARLESVVGSAGSGKTIASLFTSLEALETQVLR